MSTAVNRQYFPSTDGLNICYRDYGAENPGTPMICLPGLTRNSRDFDELAQRFSRRRRVVTIDFRGRGYSDYDPDWQNYHPSTYVSDIWALLALLNIDKVIVIGTSLGGLCAMAMAAEHRERIAGIIMNDIGPEINPAGIARIQDYTGRLDPVANWAAAAQQTKAIYGEWLPGFSEGDFLRMARRAYREIESDVPRLDFDPDIGRAIREVGAQKGDPWQYFAALRDVPVILFWGVLSDILTMDIIDKMKAEKPDLEVVPVAERGHVPLLDEPECLSAIAAFIAKVA